MSTYPRIAINDGDGLIFLYTNDILYCVSKGGFTHLYLTDKSQITVTKKLKEVCELLKEDSFVRVHHSHVINLTHLIKFVNTDMNYVTMSNGEQLSVSRSRKSEFLNKFTRL